jgi:hypothetical protein
MQWWWERSPYREKARLDGRNRYFDPFGDWLYQEYNTANKIDYPESRQCGRN